MSRNYYSPKIPRRDNQIPLKFQKHMGIFVKASRVHSKLSSFTPIELIKRREKTVLHSFQRDPMASTWTTAAATSLPSIRRKGGDPCGSFLGMQAAPRRINLTVKATGGGAGAAKFKGTRMREKQLTEMIEQKVSEAKQVCEGDETSDECKVAWDEVEEISQAKADFRRRLEKQDPLEYFCQDNPDTDECRVFED